MKFKEGDIVNCIVKSEGYAGWQNATVIKIRESSKFPITCICDDYPGEEGDFSENELELAEDE